MTMSYRLHSASVPGRGRALNEDSLATRALPDGGVLAVLADGVGGRPGGAFASRLVVEHLTETVTAAGPEALREAGIGANAALRRARGRHPGYEEMATTLVAVLAWEDQAALLHAGDSRCYRWRGGELEALTRDHTVAEQMVADGTISREDAARSPYQHLLTRAVGIAAEFAHCLQVLPVRPGDVLLLCSDGLCKGLAEPAMADVLAREPDAERALAALLAAADGSDDTSIIYISAEGT